MIIYRIIINAIFFIAIAAISSCNNKEQFILRGIFENKTENGTILIKNSEDSTLYSENFSNGSFLIKGKLPEANFYKVFLNLDNKEQATHDIWLNADSTTISYAKNIIIYPHIASSAKEQIEWNHFNDLYKALTQSSMVELKSAKENLTKKEDLLRGDAYNNLLYAIDKIEEQQANEYLKAASAFIQKYPSSSISYKIVNEAPDLDDKASQYANLLMRLEGEIKSRKETISLLEKLQNKSKIAIGKKLAIRINGQDVEGNPFNISDLNNKKIILLEFWKSTNTLGRTFRPTYQEVYNQYKDSGFEIVGISMDTNKEWWTNAITQDKVTWKQYSDLQGIDSPNTKHYNIESIPYSILMSTDGEILEVDLPAKSLAFEISKYLAKNR